MDWQAELARLAKEKRWSPGGRVRILGVEWFEDEDRGWSVLLRLQAGRYVPGPRQVPRVEWSDESWLQCLGVTGLKLDWPDHSLPEVSGFEILDIRDRQWELERYEIRDYEESVIHLWCARLAAGRPERQHG